jgi:hypothetical protein
VPFVIPKILKEIPKWVVWKYNAEQKKLPYQAKHPDHEARVNDESTFAEYQVAVAVVDAGHADGVGFVLGDGISGVDIDDCRDPKTGSITPFAKAIVEALNTYAEISPSGTGIKLYLRAWLGKNHARPGLEIYGARRYFCVTGQHLSGTPIDLESRGDELSALVEKEFGAADIDDSNDTVDQGELAPEPDDNGELIEGGRNNALARYAGSLRRIGLDDDEMLAALLSMNRKRCKPPLEAHEVQTIAKSIGRHAPSKAERAIEWMNERHAMLVEAGKAIIVSERYDPVLKRTVMDRADFIDIKKIYCDHLVKLKTPGGKSVSKPLGDYWLTHPGRRKYMQLVFDPEVQHPPDILNLWRGFAVTPRKGSWSYLREHLHRVIAGGRDDVFSYFEGWMARAVQKPGRPGEVALVMRGAQGAGKGVLARSFGHVFGQHFVHVARAHHLVGHFNSHLQDAVLVFADEAVWGGDKTAEGALKALITEPTLPIERKGRDAYVVKNVIHLMMASNNEWAVPAGLDDRRFCVVDVLSKNVGKHDYFSTIRKELQAGGYEALLYDLLHYDLSKFDHRKPPQTEAALHQKMLGMTPVQKWWFDKLKSGQLLPWHADWKTEVSRRELHDDYINVLQKVGINRRGTETDLAMQLKELLPGVGSVRRMMQVRVGIQANGAPVLDKRNERCWVLFPLAACRQHFEKMVKQKLEWDDDTIPTQQPLKDTEY